ncbi:hypothetical protein P4132_12110 [Pseudomonas aeruginosa]|nr:hypothetical protein [Pseudomonas aeruginosa]
MPPLSRKPPRSPTALEEGRAGPGQPRFLAANPPADKWARWPPIEQATPRRSPILSTSPRTARCRARPAGVPDHTIGSAYRRPRRSAWPPVVQANREGKLSEAEYIGRCTARSPCGADPGTTPELDVLVYRGERHSDMVECATPSNWTASSTTASAGCRPARAA